MNLTERLSKRYDAHRAACARQGHPVDQLGGSTCRACGAELPKRARWLSNPNAFGKALA